MHMRTVIHYHKTSGKKKRKMGLAVPMVIMTLFWAIVGGVLPWIVPKGPNRGYV